MSQSQTSPTQIYAELAIIGSGLAGVTAALTAANAGIQTCLVKGRPGASALSSGLFAGHHIDEVTAFDANQPTQSTVPLLRNTPIIATVKEPLLLADTWGRLFQADSAQPSQLRGDLLPCVESVQTREPKENPNPIVGIVQCGYHRASPDPASHFTKVLGLPCVDIVVSVPSRYHSPFQIATAFEREEMHTHESLCASWLQEIQTQQKEHPTMELLLFPPVLGLTRADEVCEYFSTRLQLRCGELLANTPSVPGYRLQQNLEQILLGAPDNLILLDGLAHHPTTKQAPSGQAIDSCIISKDVRSMDSHVTLKAKQWLLATGSWIGGGLDKQGAGPGSERFLGLPLQTVNQAGNTQRLGPSQDSVSQQRLAHQPLLCAGVQTNEDHLICDTYSSVTFTNVRATGGVVASGHRSHQEISQDAVAAAVAAVAACQQEKKNKAVEGADNG